MARPRILIVGGSTRAAADSVRRAGWQPVCADLFADHDLRKTAEVISVSNYPESIPNDVLNTRADGWFFCGALENHPQIVNRMLTADAAYGPLQGTLPEALTYVRDPIWLQKILRTANLPALEIRDQETPPNPDGTWVQKPIKSAGGRSIRIWDETAFRFPLKEPHYFQQRVAGIGLSCILRIDQGQVHWCGASRELATSSRSRAPTHFAYCGSISLDESFTSKNGFDLARLRGRSIEIAKLLVEQTSGLNGLIGIDLLFDNDEFWVLEVNPRYTASVEVLELATGKSLLNFQADSRELQIPRHRSLTPTISAKQILYAERSIVVPDLSQYWAGDDPWKSPFLADIPVPNSMVEESWPICTVLADGLTPEIVEAKLHERITVVRKALFPT